MSENGKWYVGDMMLAKDRGDATEWSYAFDTLSWAAFDDQEYAVPIYTINLEEASAAIDFIVELVHEIEKLQTENIRLEDELDFAHFADAMYRDGMAEVYNE